MFREEFGSERMRVYMRVYMRIYTRRIHGFSLP